MEALGCGALLCALGAIYVALTVPDCYGQWTALLVWTGVLIMYHLDRVCKDCGATVWHKTDERGCGSAKCCRNPSLRWTKEECKCAPPGSWTCAGCGRYEPPSA